MFEALGLSHKEIRRRLNKDNALVKSKLKYYGRQALKTVVLSKRPMKRIMGNLLTLRDILLLESNNESYRVEKNKNGYKIIKNRS